MIRIAISPEAFEALCATLPFGSVSYEKPIDEHGARWIWLERRWLDKLNSHRRTGERYSDVILRLAREDGGAAGGRLSGSGS
jgi:hypothetical protein